jgi:hypothetical protein
MTAITTRMERAATFAGRSPRILEAHAVAGLPQLECGPDTPSRAGRSPGRRPGDFARPWRTRTTSAASPHTQGGGRGDTGRRRPTAALLRSATSGCTTHRASASTRPGAPSRLPREPGRAVPRFAAVVRTGCAGRSERELPLRHTRQRSSELFADRQPTPRGWLPIPADGRRPQSQRTQQGRRTQPETSQLHCWLPSRSFGRRLTSRADRTSWPSVTIRIPERLDG